MANGVYDDQKEKTSGDISDDDLRDITGIGIDREDQIDAAARDEAGANNEGEGRRGVPESDARAAKNRRAGQRQNGRQDKDNPGAFGDGGSLGEKESKAATASSTDGKALSPGQLKSAEDNTPWGGLFNPGDEPAKPTSLKGRVAGIPGRRKAFMAVGAGGVVALFLSILTIAPVFRIPSIMGSVLGFVGEQVEDLAEHRAQRLIISYLIQRAGGNPDRYVISDSLVDSLWKTFRVNNLEDKIKRETGIEIKRGEDGNMHLFHKDEDLGVVNDYDEVVTQLEGHPQAQKDFMKISKVLAKVKERLFSSGTRKAFNRRYLLRMSVPEKDPKLSDAENEVNLKKEQVNVVTRMNVAFWNSLFDCVFSNKCDAFKKDGQTPPSLPEETDATKDTAEKFKESAQEAAAETNAEVPKTGASWTKTFNNKMVLKVIGIAGAASATVGIIEAIDLASVLNHFFVNVVYDYPAVYAFPSTLAANASGAMFAQWLGFMDNIKAGKMDVLFIATLNQQTEGAAAASTAKMMSNKDPSTGIPPDFRIDSNARYPSQAMMSYYRTYLPNVIVSNATMEAWYDHVHPLVEKVGDWSGAIITFLTGNLVERALQAVFGEDWKEKAAIWALETITAFLGANVDALATGAKWMNQVFIGGQAAMNTYCEINLGCRALTPIVQKGIFDTPLLYNSSYITQSDREDMALLSFQDRLFSLDEPNSLLNTTFRAMPTNSTPLDLLSGTVTQIASLPGKLVSSFTARSYAETATLEQQAEVAGIQIMGATADDMKRDIAVEIRQLPGNDPPCPPHDPQIQFSECQADKEVARSLMCWYTNCPEYIGYEPVDSSAGFVANMRRIWESRQEAASLW